MRQSSVGAAIAAVLLLLTTTSSSQNKYVGAKFCASCHKSGKGGDSYLVWEKSQHSKAYQTLLTDKAKQVAKDKGLKNSPEKESACLKCHVTGGAGAKNVEKSYKMEEGVTCEACHGAASGYKMVHSKPNSLDQAKKAGMVVNEDVKKACVMCHNEESPTFKPFKFEERWAKIEHKLPAAK